MSGKVAVRAIMMLSLTLLNTVEGKQSTGGVSSSNSTNQNTLNENTHSMDYTSDRLLTESVDDVADNFLPGTGKKHDERQEALHAVIEYLRRHGEATPSAFKSDVYPDHPAQYDTPQSWWKNAMYKGLSELANRTDAINRADNSGKWTFNQTKETDP